MPQKRNPYALPVLRGGAGTLIGRLTGLLATGLTPSARTDNWLYAYGEVAGALDLAGQLSAGRGRGQRADGQHRRAGRAGGQPFHRGRGPGRGADPAVPAGLPDRLPGGRPGGRGHPGPRRDRADRAGCSRRRRGDHRHHAAGQRGPAGRGDGSGPAVSARDGLGGASPRRVREHARRVRRRVAAARQWNAARRAREAEAEAALLTAAQALTPGVSAGRAARRAPGGSRLLARPVRPAEHPADPVVQRLAGFPQHVHVIDGRAVRRRQQPDVRVVQIAPDIAGGNGGDLVSVDEPQAARDRCVLENPAAAWWPLLSSFWISRSVKAPPPTQRRSRRTGRAAGPRGRAPGCRTVLVPGEHRDARRHRLVGDQELIFHAEPPGYRTRQGAGIDATATSANATGQRGSGPARGRRRGCRDRGRSVPTPPAGTGPSRASARPG